MQKVSKYCEIITYSSFSQKMSDNIIDFIDKEKLIAERLTIDNAIFENMSFTQGIHKLGLDRKNLIIIDSLDNNKNYLIGKLNFYDS